jgi:hypothetical protein
MEEPMANSKNNLKLPPNSGEQAGAKVIQRLLADGPCPPVPIRMLL